jgi:glyoxylase-like metal-dependent hydrolase (beta-lactamase superfamily II)
MNGGTVVIPTSAGGSLSQYLGSLKRVLDLQPRRILAGHGPPIDQPASLLREYVAHRLGRERQILDVLAGGPLTVQDIVAQVYPSLTPELKGAAAESVLAHLLKLEEEGRAELDEDANPQEGRWSPSR